LSAFGINHEPRSLVNLLDDAHRCLEDSGRIGSDHDRRSKYHLQVRRLKVAHLDVFDVDCWNVRLECFVTENLDPAVVEVKTNLVGYFTGSLAIDQIDGIEIVVLLESLGVLFGRLSKLAGRDAHPAFGIRRNRTERWPSLSSRRPSPDGSRVLTLDDNHPVPSTMSSSSTSRSSSAIRSACRPNIFVAKVAEHVLYQILELESKNSPKTAI
jgi:hypothetical protein